MCQCRQPIATFYYETSPKQIHLRTEQVNCFPTPVTQEESFPQHHLLQSYRKQHLRAKAFPLTWQIPELLQRCHAHKPPQRPFAVDFRVLCAAPHSCSSLHID